MAKAPLELLQLFRTTAIRSRKPFLQPSSLRPLSCASLHTFHARPLPSIARHPIAIDRRRFFWNSSSKLEKTAKADPTDVPAQIAWYQHLVSNGAKDKSAFALLVQQFEADTALFKPQSEPRQLPLLASPEAWELYMRALVQTDQEAPVVDRINAATAARNALLSAAPAFTESETGKDSSETQLTKEQLAEAVVAAKHSQSNVRVTSAPASSSYVGSAPASVASAKPSEPIKVIVEEAKGSLFFRVVRSLIVIVLYSFIILTLLSLLLDGSGLMKAANSRGPASFQALAGQKKVTFEDVHGCEEAKSELQEVVDFLKDPTKFSNLGGKLPKGVLLTGPPGTGKTLLARAVAGEAGVSFLFASGSEFDELYVGVGAKRVRELFTAARKAAPCIVFIDELDAIGSKRSNRDAQHMRQTLNQLLTELDGFAQSEGVILLGATNLPQLLDKALTRPGRFDKHVAVPLPDVRGRLKILEHHAKAVKVAPNLDLAQVARGTPGFSGAELENLVNEAAVKASRDGSLLVNLSHVEWAKDKILMGSERLSAVITPEVRVFACEGSRKTSIHEGGHALAALYTKGAMPLHRVTVIPRGHSLGTTMQLPEMDRDSESYLELLARIDVAMGGRVAEELIYGREHVTTGASSDITAATKVANAMVRHFGFSDKLGTVDLSDDERLSTETLHIIEGEVRSLIEESQRRVTQLLQSKSDELKLLADALITYETLDLEEVRKVLKGEKLDRTVV